MKIKYKFFYLSVFNNKLAIEGKLVEQNENDTPAKFLLEEIKAEKEKLIKEKKIKKEKSLPEISEEEKSFDLPVGWEWCRLSDIVYNLGQKTPKNNFSYIDVASIDNIRNKLSEKEKIISCDNAPSRARKIVSKGDIIYSTVRPYLHNICIIDKEFLYEPIASTAFAVMKTHTGVINKYLFRYLLSLSFDSYVNNNGISKGVAYPAISEQNLYKGLIALPPVEEQERIVVKVDELMEYFDALEKQVCS